MIASRRPRRSRGSPCAGFASALVSACASTGAPELPDPPDGSQLVLELGEMRVYQAPDVEVCAGTLRRIELHAEGLADVFEMGTPRANVILYDEQAAIDAVCDFPVSTKGCTSWWGTSAMPSVVNHELVHVFVRAATDQVQTRPAIEEGTAWRLEGVPATLPESEAGLEALLAVQSPFDLPQLEEHHFFAWAIERYGADAVLDAHIATSQVETNEEVGLELARSFEFDSLEALQSEYVATRAEIYPALPETTVLFAAAELALGVPFDSSCSGSYTEGPEDSFLTNVVRVEVPQLGEYEVSIPEEPFQMDIPWPRPTEPSFEAPLSVERITSCPFEITTRRFYFPEAGVYSVVLTHSTDLVFEGPLSLRYLGEEPCTPS